MDSFSNFSSGTNEKKLKIHCFAFFLNDCWWFFAIKVFQFIVIGTPHIQSVPPDRQQPEPPFVSSIPQLELCHLSPRLGGLTMKSLWWCRAHGGRAPHLGPVQRRIPWCPARLIGEPQSSACEQQCSG